MFDQLYEFLADIGYGHPLHPMFVHTASGVPTVALVLALVALLYRRPNFAQSARHCMILAFIFSFPAVFFGITDWQYFYSGVWLDPIAIKIALAGALLIFLGLAIFFGRGGRFASKLVLGIYALAFLCVVALGYFGAELAFGTKAPPAPPEYQAGEKLYMKNCSACHPFGGNIVNAKLSVTGAPELVDFKIFLLYLRDPKQPKPTIPLMPIVPPTKISDEQAKQLYDYITKVLERPRRPLDPSLYPMPPS
jgi:mono/diheme cytochrome c family protein